MGNTIITTLYRSLYVAGTVEINILKLTTFSENGMFVIKGGSALCVVWRFCIKVNEFRVKGDLRGNLKWLLKGCN